MIAQLLAAASLLTQQHTEVAPCPVELALQFEGQTCVVTSSGLAVASSSERAAELLAWAEAGRARFATQLGVSPSSYAVIDKAGGPLSKRAHSALAMADYTVILEWLPPAEFQQKMEDNVARSVRKQLIAAGLQGERLEAALGAAVAQLARHRDAAAIAERDGIVVPHELAHKWLREAFWSDSASLPNQYGTPAPDWLDEIAALVAEPDESLAHRREQFWSIYRSDLAADREPRFASLTCFLAAAHPMTGRMSEAGGGFTVQVLEIEDQGIKGANPNDYYLQSLLFRDFLVAHGLDAQGFNRLIAAIASGKQFSDFLVEDGAEIKLPTSSEALEAHWRAWLSRSVPGSYKRVD